MSQTEKQKIGAWGEQQAVHWLQDNGYEIVERNFFARFGELDIIAKHIATGRLCFIEVKTRKRKDGSAERATSLAKQTRMKKAAEQYCRQNNINPDETILSFEHISVYTVYNNNIKHYVLPSY